MTINKIPKLKKERGNAYVKCWGCVDETIRGGEGICRNASICQNRPKNCSRDTVWNRDRPSLCKLVRDRSTVKDNTIILSDSRIPLQFKNYSYPLNGTPFRGEPVTLSLEFDEVIWPYFVTFPREPSFRDAFALMLKISSVGLQNTPAFCWPFVASSW